MRVPTSQQLTCRQMDIVAIAICVAMSLLAYFVGLVPVLERHAQRAVQAKDLVSARRDLARLSNAVLALNGRLSAAKEQLAGCEVRLESADQINTRVAHLTSLLSDNGLEADTLQTGKAVSGLQYSLVPIAVEGTGGFVQALSFLHCLGTTLKDVGAIQFSLSGDPSKPLEPGRFKMDFFWYTTAKGKTTG
jgi:Tfp pilus assembly protein PilO